MGGMAEQIEEPSDGTMSTAILKAFSNPIRRRIVRELVRDGSGRAADIAAQLDLPANQVSFHLRVLADAGLIAEAPELARDRRDRVWRNVPGIHALGSPEDPMKDSELGHAVLVAFGAEYRAVLDRVLKWAPKYVTGQDPVVHGTMVEMNFRLTEQEFESLINEINDVVQRYMGLHEDRSREDVRAWEMILAAADDSI